MGLGLAILYICVVTTFLSKGDIDIDSPTFSGIFSITLVAGYMFAIAKIASWIYYNVQII